jgi:ABC-2 type transport system ATP-binding protein
MTNAIRFDGVTLRYGRHTVLNTLGIDVVAGEFFGLVGINGAGKTTCVKALLDLNAINGGRIEIFGIPHQKTRARARLAFLPERFLPPYYLRGRDFLNFYARLRHAKFDEARIREMCSALDLDPQALDKSVRIYSKGMAQKLGLIACLLSDKDLLIVDEPMSGLDPKARLLVKRQMQALKERGRTVFMSTHMLSDVEELCDRMGILHAGRLRFVGTPAECCAQYGTPSLEQAYLNCISDEEPHAA